MDEIKPIYGPDGNIITQASYDVLREAHANLANQLAAHKQHDPLDFQGRVHEWMLTCFSVNSAFDPVERNHRFLEESLELVQSLGLTKSEALQLVDYVYGRPAGEAKQEVGGVLVTLAALCTAAGLSMTACSELEVKRIWTKIEQIRAKQAAKPQFSPLPERSE